VSIISKEYKPTAELSPYVEFFWSGQFNINAQSLLSQRVIPNGYIELIIHLTDSHCELYNGSGFSSSPDNLLIGLFTKPYDVHFREQVNVFGIRFKPEGIYHLYGLPASEIQANFADMESITGRNFREYSSRICESKKTTEMIRLSEIYLRKNINTNKMNLYYLNRAAEIIRRSKGQLTIDELAGKVYISSRQLEREFRDKIGMSPKSYMRIARLNEVNRHIQDGQRKELTNLSYECGYTD
jgi:AraC-like DNA-binding protein